MQLTLAEITSAVAGELINGNPKQLIKGVSTDTRSLQPGDLFVPLTGEHFDGHSFISVAMTAGGAASLWNRKTELPAVAMSLILVDDTLVALQKLARYYRHEVNPIVIGITGSNGKTTTKDILSAILAEHYHIWKTEGNLNNHIGLPLTILSMPEETEVLIVEMGMNHLGEIALLTQIAEPDHVIITNIGESHIEFLKTEAKIIEAKLEILLGLADGGYAILPGDQEPVRSEVARRGVANVRWIGLEKANDNYVVDFHKDDLAGITFSDKNGDRYQLPLIGNHNAVNALMAIEVAKILRVDVAKIQAGLLKVQASGMRLEIEKLANGSIILNDAYNASPTSTSCSVQLLAAIADFPYKVAVLGDMLELGSESARYHYRIGNLIAELEIDYLITIGNFAQDIIDGAIDNGFNIANVYKASTVEEIADVLSKHEQLGSAILVKGSRGNRLERVVELLLKNKA
jgi:UDP-N-acetylmuramoyl-tripeptide--D-alanyl-D-alanine ligase